MNVLIVDDEALAREELVFLVKDNVKISSVHEADTIDSAFRIISEFKIDLLFLDIQLGNENGFDLADDLKERKNAPKIIFATAYDQYALDAFNASAVDYVLKPFEQERINEAIDKVSEIEPVRDLTRITNPRISITEDEKTAVILKNDIIAAYVENGDLIVNTTQRLFRTKQTLVKFAESLDREHFLQVHRSYLVNLDKIASVEPSFNHTYELTMNDGSKIPVSRSFIAEMKRALSM
ncbi:response regulator [Paucilactobacillus oligofermentans DSM 15707 = LMG 22743]|uniref:Response regulator n=1 Tax=Paucilactobacillus oligofermentans DSM 15707 = LMG 22743 TaxID=1423778 RepID=A0A0R1RQ86_9LACO|nr:LytTR family transcriptional regulator DNA-binding domain-containing protein [Paucilactobacillus oligofermentans]KRL55555.1 response regulator [Paucilactobacillus oligofermentans DSM 15707 = LMG 22743]CUS25457.1 Sensory transduction protein lytTR [Paucilactobacillus oligofermentans DSM 15707 = LMG 22743]